MSDEKMYTQSAQIGAVKCRNGRVKCTNRGVKHGKSGVEIGGRAWVYGVKSLIYSILFRCVSSAWCRVRWNICVQKV